MWTHPAGIKSCGIVHFDFGGVQPGDIIRRLALAFQHHFGQR